MGGRFRPVVTPPHSPTERAHLIGGRRPAPTAVRGCPAPSRCTGARPCVRREGRKRSGEVAEVGGVDVALQQRSRGRVTPHIGSVGVKFQFSEIRRSRVAHGLRNHVGSCPEGWRCWGGEPWRHDHPIGLWVGRTVTRRRRRSSPESRHTMPAGSAACFSARRTRGARVRPARRLSESAERRGRAGSSCAHMHTGSKAHNASVGACRGRRQGAPRSSADAHTTRA